MESPVNIIQGLEFGVVRLCDLAWATPFRNISFYTFNLQYILSRECIWKWSDVSDLANVVLKLCINDFLFIPMALQPSFQSTEMTENLFIGFALSVEVIRGWLDWTLVIIYQRWFE